MSHAFYVYSAWGLTAAGVLGVIVQTLVENFRLQAELKRLDAKGKFTAFSMQPYWLQVVLMRGAEPDNALYLRSHGKHVEIGSFLSAPERCDFAGEHTRVLERNRSDHTAPQQS